MFDISSDKYYVVKYTAPLSKLAFHIVDFGFEDNTNIIQTSVKGDDYVIVANKL